MSKVTPITSTLKPAPNSRSRTETLLIEMRTIAGWKIPPFQRQLRVNEKVREIAENIRHEGGVIPGVITVGILKGGRDAGDYLIDGQHRIEAFRLSECSEAIADVRFMQFDSMAQMGEEFVQLNSNIVRMRPDDVLRGLEASTPVLSHIRQKCPWIGYDQIRHGPSSALLSMSTVLRAWDGASGDTPVSSRKSAIHLASEMSMDNVNLMIVVLALCYDAWSLDEASKRLWGALNLGVVMWMWRRLVLDTARTGNMRYIVLRNEQFKRCLMSVAANASYNDWLVGRQMGDRDRAPAYARLRQIFTRRLLEDKVAPKIQLPGPAWAKG